HVHVELEPIAEPGDVIPRALREKLQSEFSDQGPIRPSDRLAVHARLRGDFVEGPRHTRLPARRVQRRRDDLVDRASPDEVLRRGPPIEYGGVLAHVAGQSHLRGHRVDLRAGIVPHEVVTAAFWALRCDLYLSHLIRPPPTEE